MKGPRPIFVTGLGLWSPGYGSVASWLERRADPAVDMPRCRLIDARLKRGSSRFARMLAEVVEHAAKAGGLDPRVTPMFYTSSLGEIETMCILLRMLIEENGALSPTRFKNSVHNAASGLVSISTGNTEFTTALAGGDGSFQIGVLEAWTLLDELGGQAILAVADDRPPEPLHLLHDHGGLAIAFALATERPAGPCLELSGLRRAEAPIPAQIFLPEDLVENPAAAALPLLHAVAERRAGPIPLAPKGGPGWALDARPLD